MKKSRVILMICLWFIFLLSLPISHVEPVENKAVEIGAAFDVDNAANNKDFFYKITRNVSLYSDVNDKLFSQNLEGVGYSIGKTRENRQDKDNKIPLQGMEKAYLFSEAQAKLGIRPCIDILFKNPYLSDNGVFALCSGQGKNILELNIPGYVSPLDYIYGLIKNSRSSNFFSDNYDMATAYIRIDGEGRNMVVPFIEIKENSPYIWGCGIFIKDTLRSKIDMNEAKIMNLLRENNVMGIVSINDSEKKYIDYQCISHKKVKCEKLNGRYTFTITLNLKGSILNNEINDNVINDKHILKNFEQLFSQEIEKESYKFIDKMQHEYKVDWLELGKYAVAKTGRKTNTDWNEEVINNSDIVVKVNVTISTLGRGDY